MRFVDVKNDVAFRKIFGNEKKKVILISFLNAVLDLYNDARIIEVSLVDPFQLPRIRGEKASIIDVRAKDMKGRSFIIEMQVAEKEGFAKRIQYYISKDYAAQINIGDNYPQLKPVYFIGILNFNFFPNSNYFSKHLIVDEETGVCTLEDLKFRFIELKKFTKEKDELESIIDKWTFFIKKAHKLEVIPENLNDEGLKTAYEEAERHNWTKEEYDAYINSGMRAQDYRGGLSFAEKRGIEKGITKGIKKQLVESVLGMNENGIPIPVIALSLKISEDEVKEILGGVN